MISETLIAQPFTLSDQYGTSKTVTWPRAKACVFLFGDKESARHIESWAQPLYEEFGDAIEFYGLADLSAVPALFRPIALAAVKTFTKRPVLLDWTGATARAYGCATSQANIFVISPSGKILTHQTGPADAAGLDAARQALKSTDARR